MEPTCYDQDRTVGDEYKAASTIKMLRSASFLYRGAIFRDALKGHKVLLPCHKGRDLLPSRSALAHSTPSK